MSRETGELICRTYQVAEEKDIAAWVARSTDDGTFTDESIKVVYRGPEKLGDEETREAA